MSLQEIERKHQFYFTLLMLGLVFSRLETTYFGNNMMPGSWAEVVCDFIGFAWAVCAAGHLAEVCRRRPSLLDD